MFRDSSHWLAHVSVLLALLGAGCSNHPGVPAAADTRAADEAAIRAAVHSMDQALIDKDLEKAVSMYEDGAVLFISKSPAIVGKDAVRQAWQSLMAVPGLKMTVTVRTVDVARSGELAVARGGYEVSSTDKDGKTNFGTGHFVLVWKKQADGSWKLIADTNADDK